MKSMRINLLSFTLVMTALCGAIACSEGNGTSGETLAQLEEGFANPPR